MFTTETQSSIENINIQNIPPGGATVTVGGATLDPAPFVSMSLEQYRTNDIIVGGVLIVSLNGTVYTTGGAGFSDIAAKLKARLGIARNGDCIDLNINCGGTTLVNGKGLIRSFSIDEGPDPTWTQIAAYSIDVEIYINEGQLVVEPNQIISSYITANEIIKEFSESATITVDNDAFAVDSVQGQKAGRAHAKYSFNISATGGSASCQNLGSGKKSGIEAAEEVVKRRLSALENGNLASSLGNPTEVINGLTPYLSGSKYMQVRSMDADPFTGTLTVSGDLILRPSGVTYPQAFVEVTVDSRAEAAQVGRSVTVSGTIEGLYSAPFSNLITNSNFHSASTNRMANAESAFSGIKGIAQSLATSYLEGQITDPCASTSGLTAICSNGNTNQPTECALRLISRSVTRNFGQGTISFSDEYSTVKTCSIPGAARVESEVTHTYPTDVFAEFTIPFRGEPLLQNLGTTTKEVIAVNINLTVENMGCDISDTSGLVGCAAGLADQIGAEEGAAGWYLTQYSVTKSNTGNLRISKEWTKPYNC